MCWLSSIDSIRETTKLWWTGTGTLQPRRMVTWYCATLCSQVFHCWATVAPLRRICPMMLGEGCVGLLLPSTILQASA